MQVASSGREVPRARMVIAMNLSLTPSSLASAVALSTKRLPPQMRAARPPVIISNDSTQIDRLKTFIVTGRTQEIVFDRETLTIKIVKK